MKLEAEILFLHNTILYSGDIDLYEEHFALYLYSVTVVFIIFYVIDTYYLPYKRDIRSKRQNKSVQAIRYFYKQEKKKQKQKNFQMDFL